MDAAYRHTHLPLGSSPYLSISYSPLPTPPLWTPLPAQLHSPPGPPHGTPCSARAHAAAPGLQVASCRLLRAARCRRAAAAHRPFTTTLPHATHFPAPLAALKPTPPPLPQWSCACRAPVFSPQACMWFKAHQFSRRVTFCLFCPRTRIALCVLSLFHSCGPCVLNSRRRAGVDECADLQTREPTLGCPALMGACHLASTSTQ